MTSPAELQAIRPPFPPMRESTNTQLERWGVTWPTTAELLHQPMPDGYWTPWHLAVAALDAQSDEVRRLREALELARSHIREHDDHVGDCELSQSDGDAPCSCDYGFTLTQIDAALAPTSPDPVRSAGEAVPERGKCDDKYGMNNPYSFERADVARILEEFRKGTVHFDSGDDAIIAWIIRDWQRAQPERQGAECVHCYHAAHPSYCTADECHCAAGTDFNRPSPPPTASGPDGPSDIVAGLREKTLSKLKEFVVMSNDQLLKCDLNRLHFTILDAIAALSERVAK
jgi:hypothetical protein